MPTDRRSPYVRLEELLRGPEGRQVRRLDQQMGAATPTNLITIITLPDPRLSRMGSLLVDNRS
jgi:hypothetical protein